MDQPPKEPRSPVNLRIKFRSESLEQFVERYAIDVSRGGIFIRTREPLAVGTQLKLDFQYQSGIPLMAGDGTVVWIRDPDPNRPTVPPGMGVRFDRLTAESQVVLEQLLTEKAAREKGGAAQAAAAGAAGGMAVRRPSSMFAALEQNDAKTTVGPIPTGPSNAEPVGAQAVPPPRYTVAAMPLVSQPGLPGATTKPAASPRAGGSPLPPLTANESPTSGGYKPLGTARNPFSVGHGGASAKDDPASAARMAATIFGTGAKAPASTLRELSNAATGADELDEEPTQIAGRMPAFLSSDEDPTSVGAYPTDNSRITTEQPAATGRNLAKLTSGMGRPFDPASNRDAARLDPLPGSLGRVTGGHSSTQATEASRKASLDSMPPVGGPPGPPRRGAIDRGTDALLDPEPRFSRPGLGMPEQPRPFDPLAAFGSGPNSVTETPAPTPAPAPVRTTPPKEVAAAPLAPTASAAKPAAKRSSGLLVGAIVLILGGAAFFVFRFFESQASQVASAPSSSAIGVSAASTAEPPTVPLGGTNSVTGKVEPREPAEAAKAEVPAVAATAGAEAKAGEAKTGETKVGEAKPSEAKAGEAKVGEAKAGEAKAGEAKVGEAKAGEAKAGEAKAGEAKPSEAKPTEAKLSEAKPAEAKVAEAKPPASKPVAMVERKAVKRKPVRGTRDTEAAPAEAPAAAPAAPGEPAAPAAAAPEAAAAGHQIRVTSKPSGADVTIDGQVVGQTPLSTGVSDVSAPHFVSVRKEGFEPFEQMISATSAWAKGKPVKGQPAIPTLKINAKLKSSGGGEAKPAAGGEGAKEAPGKADPDSPAPPSDMAPAPSAP